MATSKNRLGRGLGSIISGGTSTKPATTAKSTTPTSKANASKPSAKADASIPAGEYREVPINKIDPNPYQPRRDMDPDRVKELAESIRSEGLLQPIVVRPGSGSRFQLVAGERRWRACQSLGMTTIPVRVMDAGDASSAVIALIENLQREGLNPVDESLGYASLMRDFDLTQEEVAQRVGKGRATVANALRLLQLDRETQGYLAKGLLSAGHAKVLLGLEDESHRTLLARRIIEQGASVREAEKLVRKIKGEQSNNRNRSSRPEAELQVVEKIARQLSTHFNTSVSLKHSPKKGRITIEYYGNEDLQRILERLGVRD
jgi:ParB family chromosome partitioning protein